jgi:colanic acid biosynthesis protein WcaH
MTDQPQDRPSTHDFLQVVRLSPMVSIDIIVRNPRGEVLLGLRANEPAKGTWFVPGGRVLKNESLDAAFGRITRVELGVSLSRADARLLGPYEHLYGRNFANAPGIGTHYVALAHEIEVAQGISAPADDQHGEFRWWRVEDLLNSPDVHPYTKAYFQLATR